MEGLAFVLIAVGVLLFVAPLGIWNRLIKMHGDMKKAVALLERIANSLEGRSAAQSAPAAANGTKMTHASGYSSRKWMG